MGESGKVRITRALPRKIQFVVTLTCPLAESSDTRRYDTLSTGEVDTTVFVRAARLHRSPFPPRAASPSPPPPPSPLVVYERTISTVLSCCLYRVAFSLWHTCIRGYTGTAADSYVRGAAGNNS